MTPTLQLHAERVRRTPWTIVLRNAWLLLLGGMFLGMVLPASLFQAVRPLLLAMPVLMLAAKDLSHLPDALERTWAALAARDWRRLPAAWLPPELVGLLRLGRAQRRGCIAWLLRRPQPAAPAGQAFGYLGVGAYRTVFAIAVFCVLVELPLDAAIVAVLPVDPDKRRLLHVVMTMGGIATLAWVLGDRWLVGAGCHALDGAILRLRVGARAAGDIPLAAIADCRRIDEPAARWCARHGVDVLRTLTVSPFDKPNAVLVLKRGERVRLEHLGRERAGIDCVFLYVDRPDALVDAVGAARTEG